ncbi:MAG: hypothetical protein CMM25_05430 [Rhodospirillaceae bacterium]|nr:hypothetical protein [Rhodospirillaceae bacterium]|tara:strand:+ start:669 stop:1166 length:498 start_codon:yes stop_codon:yes gene_type:complete
MALIDDISTEIQVDNSSFSDDFSGTDILAMKKYGWRKAAEKVKEEANSGIVVEQTISNGAISTEDDAYWGLDMFNSSIKASLLNGSALFAYRCNTAFKKKYVLFVDTKVFKFSEASVNHFNNAKTSVPTFSANHFFINDSNYNNSANATSSLNRANAMITNQYTQ